MAIVIFGGLLAIWFACGAASSQYSWADASWQISEKTEMSGQYFKLTIE